MATVNASGSSGPANTANLSSAQTGTGDSTNTADTGRSIGPALLKVTSTVGATPTVTVNVVGSADGTNFFNVPYAVSTAPTSVVVAALTITTATTGYYYLQPNIPWRYLKLVYSANTNVTISADLWVW